MKKHGWIIAAIVVLAGFVWWMMWAVNTAPMATVSPGPSGLATPKPGAAMPQSYLSALKTYEGRRIQFDMYCSAIPTSLSYKNGVSLMLDNRSGDPRVIEIAGVKHSLAGYGWTVVTLSVAPSQLPAKLNINCGTAKNVSSVLLQK